MSLHLVNRLESSTVMPTVTLNALVAIAHALGCDPHELLVPSEAPRPRRAGKPEKTPRAGPERA